MMKTFICLAALAALALVSGQSPSTNTMIPPTVANVTESQRDNATEADTPTVPSTQEPTNVPTNVTTYPSTVTPTPNPVENSTSHYHSSFKNPSCNFTACVEPKCQCLDDKPPKGLLPESIPQFITITFDGAVTVTNFPNYKDLFTLTNPNKCPVTATYFVSHVDTNYKLVHELHRHGNEIGAHSISKSKNNWQDYWKNLDYEGWVNEFGGQKKIISKYASIPLEQIKGARAPNLQTAGNLTIAALVNEKFEYDCSSPSRLGIKSPFFPYTFDYGGQRGQDCPVAPCLDDDQVFPGFWEVPMNDLNSVYTIKGVKYERECATAAGCLLFKDNGSVKDTPSADEIFELFMTNFNRFYNGNRAPFPLYLSEDWIQQKGKRDGLIKFINEVLTKHKDVYFVTIEEVINWMKHGASAAEYAANSKCKPIEETKCAMTDLTTDELDLQFTNHCDFEEIGELDGQTKRMFICDGVSCPAHYPWTGRPEA